MLRARKRPDGLYTLTGVERGAVVTLAQIHAAEAMLSEPDKDDEDARTIADQKRKARRRPAPRTGR